MKNNSSKSFLPYLVLIIGLILVVIVFSISFVPSFFPNEHVGTIEDAKELSDQYITKYYSGLEISEIMEFTENYYVITIERQTGIGAFELLIDRSSGRISPEPGPNMMWNTKYGRHGRFSDSSPDMSIDKEDAVMIAQDWLNMNTAGYRVVETTRFYGYYTMDFGENEEIIGMLSVNGESGEVWYHSWHGDFISMKEYD